MRLRYFSEGWSTDFDGPGRRWILYLYGCNLRCSWCANPESFLPPVGAGRAGNRPEALREMAVTELVEQALWRGPLFGGGGGVTFGGGEPTLQAPALLEAVRALRGAGISTVIESNAATGDFAAMVGEPDLLICDLKTLTHETAQAHTGADLARVRENLLLAAQRQRDLWVRIPCVAGVNLVPPERAAITDLLCAMRARRPALRVDLLRQHHLGEPKYAALGREYPLRGRPLPAPQELDAFAGELRSVGLTVRVFA